VANFLALGIGILIGSIMLGNDTLVKQQQQLTRKLELQIEELRKKNEAVQVIVNNLEVSNDFKEQFEKQSLPFLVAGRLSGYQVAIIEINHYRFLPELTETLKTSGATVSSVTTVFSDLDYNQEEIQAIWGQKDLTPELIAKRLANEIGQNIIAGENQKLINFLTTQGIIKATGQYGVPLNGVIIIRENQAQKTYYEVDTFDLPLIDYFLKQKISVFGVEETKVDRSCMKAYQRKEITTVDNIDTIPGQAALVLALAGNPGHYGVKPTAQSLLPKSDVNLGKKDKGKI
jgi:hypothetical protein